MRVLSTSSEIGKAVTQLLEKCSSFQVAVAWASVHFDAYDALMRNIGNVERMVVGTHFFQTHPMFIESLMAHQHVKFILKKAGVFHPKVYLFEMADGGWECVLGSPNFTQSGFSLNDEMAVILSNHDQNAPESFAAVKAAINGYWLDAQSVGPEELDAYREAWKRKQPLVKQLQGKFGPPDKENEYDRGDPPFCVPILQMSWPEYFERVKTEKDYPPHAHSMEGRLPVITAAQSLFERFDHFKEIDLMNRKRIAGLVVDEDVNYLWFGSMRGAGRFKQAIAENSVNISLALDQIPLTGAVSREQYLAFTERYDAAFPAGGGGVATATRLLAMKRPDTFICLSERNKERLCQEFRISRSVDYEKYWDSIIERIRDSAWWCAPSPERDGVERQVWHARTAFLDAIFYDGKDMSAG